MGDQSSSAAVIFASPITELHSKNLSLYWQSAPRLVERVNAIQRLNCTRKLTTTAASTDMPRCLWTKRRIIGVALLDSCSDDLKLRVTMYKPLICTVLLIFGISHAQEPSSTTGNEAKLSQAELLGTTAGRVLGAAKMCEVKSDRLQSIAKHTFAVIDQIAHSQSDRASADQRMRDSLNLGEEDIRQGRSTCQSSHSALNKLEQRLAQQASPK